MNLQVESGTSLENLLDRAQSVLMSNYSRQQLAISRGAGCRVWDQSGREYLDFVAGIAVNVLGHAHPAVTNTIARQAIELVHCSNLYLNANQVLLAERLVETAFPGRTFFCNSGTEANEAAIKIARKWGRLNKENAYEIICMSGAFHGRTMGALSATANPRYRDSFAPLPEGFVHVAFNDAAAVADAISRETVAVMIEPVQGESGINVLDDDILQTIRRLCDENNLLLIADEVQSGMGRTGRWWAHQHAGIKPDLMTIAKGLGGGLPIGAVLADSRADCFEPGDHGCTFGGGPLITAVALAVIETLQSAGLLAHATELGDYLVHGLLRMRDAGLPVQDVRGRGLMLGVVLDRPIAAKLVRAALDNGLLLNGIGDNVIRMVPPLILEIKDADEGLEKFEAALRSAAA